jgi:formate hydrogenlyase subunit 3/multisubunit Na+/H+ antiporter MnhD subunit
MRIMMLMAPFAAGLLFALWIPSGWQLHMGWFLFGLDFTITDFRKIFLIFTAFVWLVCAYAAAVWTPNTRAGFWLQMHLTYFGNMTLILCADAVGFYLFFSLMSLSAFGLIMHDRTKQAKEAAISYIKFALTGEILIFAGVVMLVHYNDTALFTQMHARLPQPAVVVILAGFGIKAGLFLLHPWLPKAHARAPGPISALLSGVMLKTGVLGWIQFLSFGQYGYDFAGWMLAGLGLVGIYFGLYGLFVRGLKEVLAYSSISQMGYLALISGGILLQPALFAQAKEAILFFMLHHGMAKAALFLLASGIIKNGRSKATLLLALLAAAFLIGLPFTSGAIAKNIS